MSPAWRRLLWLWLGELASSAGTQLTAFGLGVWALQRTGQVREYALFALLALGPRLLVTPWAGVLVDRFDRRRVLMAGHAGAGACSLGLAALFALGEPELPWVLALVALASVASAAQYPAFQATTAALMPSADLPRANALVHVGNAGVLVLAPALGAALLTRWGVFGVLCVDVLSFGFGLSVLAWLRLPNPPGDRGHERRPSRAFVEGLRYLRGRPGLLALLGTFAALNFCLGMSHLLLTPLVLATGDALALGRVLSLTGLGMLVGAAGMLAWGGPRRQLSVVVAATLVQAGALACIAFFAGSPAWVGLGAMVAFCMRPMQAASSATLWQRNVPLELQGRVFALRSTVVQGALPLAHALAGPLVDRAFEPAMAAGSGSILGRVFGDRIGLGFGPGRGVAALMLCLALGAALAGLAPRLVPPLRRLEDPPP